LKASVVHSIIEALAGSERVALSIARLLSSMGFDVELIIVSGSKDLLHSFSREIEGVKIRMLSLENAWAGYISETRYIHSISKDRC
jgi:hypothetical protein